MTDSPATQGELDTAKPAYIELKELSLRWRKASSFERSNAHLYLIELADALGVGGHGQQVRDMNLSILSASCLNRDGTEALNWIDLYKKECFALEAKAGDAKGENSDLLRRAFGQARHYASHVDGNPPPYLLVLDVGKSIIVWNRWTRTYGGFNTSHQIDLRKLYDQSENISLLRSVFGPILRVRDPKGRAIAVTKEILGASPIRQPPLNLEDMTELRWRSSWSVSSPCSLRMSVFSRMERSEQL